MPGARNKAIFDLACQLHANGYTVERARTTIGEIVEMGKTTRSRRQVPLSQRALDARDAVPDQAADGDQA